MSKNKSKFTTIDLFAGIGGVRLGFERTGMFDTVFSNDYEKNCKPIFDLSHSSPKLVVKDIREVKNNEIPDFDFLLGGFPCQAFSVAGYREGFNDRKGRGNLFFEIARILKHKKPMGFLLENVKNLKGHNNGETFKIISQTLDELGYEFRDATLNSMEYGNVPQTRERIYIVGFRKELGIINNFKFPNKKELTVSFRDILDKNVNDKYYYNDKPLYKKIENQIKKEDTVYQWRRIYVRENKKGVCPTLTANMGMGGHNVPIIKDSNGIRKLTPRECARLQGFKDNELKIPDSLSDSALYKQMGNSVTVNVIERIAKQVIKAVK